MNTELRISRALADEMVGHLAEERPNEGCGLVAGIDGYVSKVIRMTNAAGSPVRYALDPNAPQGKRITRMELDGQPIEASKSYKVAGWAPVSEEAKAAGGEPGWDVVARYLKSRKTIKPQTLNVPRLEGVTGNPGIA